MNDIELIATIQSSAIKSECGKFRFVLGRTWDRDLPIGAFLCANPSKADELLYDITAFKCGNMAVNWNWGGFYIVNLYPNYSTDPAGVVRNEDADELNQQHVRSVVNKVDCVVLACGNGHNVRLAQLLRRVPYEKLFMLRRNKGGGFLHPSRVDPDDFHAPVLAFPSENGVFFNSIPNTLKNQ